MFTFLFGFIIAFGLIFFLGMMIMHSLDDLINDGGCLTFIIFLVVVIAMISLCAML